MEAQRVIALVTGAASGLGRATATLLVARGAKVALLDRGGSAGSELARTLGDSALFVPADVTRADQVTAALEDLEARFGVLNVLVNCAGIGVSTRALGPTGPAKLEDFNRVLQVNLVGAFNCIRLAAERMARSTPNAEGERGVIINTASVAAFDGQRGQAAYAASKAGLVGMTLPLARDLGEYGIRVNTLAPGPFETPMLGVLPEALRHSLVENAPFPRRPGRPEEFAALVLHVIENPMLNAETIRLDGGLRMPPG